jgi:SSS family solute:Na+ symporter
VIYNDILGPFRKNWSEKRGIMLNRFIVACIGVFLLLYGLWYPLKGNLWNYIIVTGTIYMSSMSVLLIACCYWKGANSWGAGAAIVIGAALPVAYLIGEQLKSTEHVVRDVIGVNKWGIATFALTAVAMIIGSLIKPGKTFNVVAAEAAAAAAKEKAGA